MTLIIIDHARSSPKTALLCLVHITCTDKTKLSCLVLSVLTVWTKWATSQYCRRQKISKLFCIVSKCGMNRVLSCLDPVFNLQLGLVCKRVYVADNTGQKCGIQSPIYGDLLKTVLTFCQLCSHHRRDKTKQNSLIFMSLLRTCDKPHMHIMLAK